ncbi:hypothetical protein GCM10011515_07510 [Tsuneonella deserti]|uniref:Uncharacterized protein n=1 Tax=Tsuneonella deserti TaxID=2035528 RepID=A0ABQ1S5N9_9SPHN|nr:hypothetical protein [Tsuneonella deserti]GGD90409.1 hypothetical protein GCM10011515_07510 [Tsuneonella deserti]
MAGKRTATEKSPSDFNIYARSGIAQGSKTWSSTQVHSSGGGGYVGPQGGDVQAAKVTSSNTTHHAFFLVEDGGKEIEISLAGVPFSVRDGHRVTAVYAGHQQDEWQWLTHLHNHHTEQSAKVPTAYRKIIGNPNVWIFFGAMALAVTLGILAESWMLFVLIIAAYAGFTLLVESPKLRVLAEELDTRAQRLIDERAAETQIAPVA